MKTKKIRYEAPRLQEVRIDTEDVIRTSGLDAMSFDGLYLGKNVNYKTYVDLH